MGPSTSSATSGGSRKTRVCVLQCSYEQTDSCFKDLDPYCTPEVYDIEGKYEWSHAYIKKATAVRQVRELAQGGQVDVFLNLCDGAFDEDRAGCEVVEALERYGCAYTGADRVFYEPSKVLQKKLAYYYDVPTASWAVLMSINMQDDEQATVQCAQAVEGLQFPLIVKHYNGGGSIGMGRDCKVDDMAALVAQVRKFVGGYGGALVEEFVEGREFTVLVVENAEDREQPLALVPVECVFGAGETFKHFDLKWRDYETMRWQPVDAQAEPELTAALKRHAAAAFVALRGTSYGRADFRVDRQGNIRFLEHNPNCGIFYPPDAMGSADYILTLDPTMNHMAFIDHIVAAAQARRAAQQEAHRVEVVYRHQHGFGMFATRDLKPGEVIVKFEETPHVLVSASYIRRIFGQDALAAPPPPAPVPAVSSAPVTVTTSTLTLEASQAAAVASVECQQVREQLQQGEVAAVALQDAQLALSSHGSIRGDDSDCEAGGVLAACDQSIPSADKCSNGCDAPTRAAAPALSLGLPPLVPTSCAHAGPKAPLALQQQQDQTHGQSAHARSHSCDSGSRLRDDGSAASSISPCPSDASLNLTLAAASAAGCAAAAGTVVGSGNPATAAAETAIQDRAGKSPQPVRSRRYLEWFRAYAYPITDETWVTWSEDPEQWLPLNHSCDPNAWLEGLDLVARRPIHKGEQITAEYATFTVHSMAPFRCKCGAASCRGLVQGTDFLQPWVGQLYEGHLSDHVAAKRRQHHQQQQQQQQQLEQ